MIGMFRLNCDYEDQRMTAPAISFVKVATIHKSEKFICVEPLSGINGLTYREDGNCRMYLDSDATNEDLGYALLDALAKSRYDNSKEFLNPDRAMRVYQEWQNDFMTRYGYRSKREAYTSLDWCGARMSEGTISIEPHNRYKADHWKSLPPDKIVTIHVTTDPNVAGAALRLALNRCK
jgi:hypothetical protein